MDAAHDEPRHVSAGQHSRSASPNTELRSVSFAAQLSAEPTVAPIATSGRASPGRSDSPTQSALKRNANTPSPGTASRSAFSPISAPAVAVKAASPGSDLQSLIAASKSVLAARSASDAAVLAATSGSGRALSPSGSRPGSQGGARAHRGGALSPLTPTELRGATSPFGSATTPPPPAWQAWSPERRPHPGQQPALELPPLAATIAMQQLQTTALATGAAMMHDMFATKSSYLTAGAHGSANGSPGTGAGAGAGSGPQPQRSPTTPTQNRASGGRATPGSGSGGGGGGGDASWAEDLTKGLLSPSITGGLAGLGWATTATVAAFGDPLSPPPSGMHTARGTARGGGGGVEFSDPTAPAAAGVGAGAAAEGNKPLPAALTNSPYIGSARPATRTSRQRPSTAAQDPGPHAHSAREAVAALGGGPIARAGGTLGMPISLLGAVTPATQMMHGFKHKALVPPAEAAYVGSAGVDPWNPTAGRGQPANDVSLPGASASQRAVTAASGGRTGRRNRLGATSGSSSFGTVRIGAGTGIPPALSHMASPRKPPHLQPAPLLQYTHGSDRDRDRARTAHTATYSNSSMVSPVRTGTAVSASASASSAGVTEEIQRFRNRIAESVTMLGPWETHSDSIASSGAGAAGGAGGVAASAPASPAAPAALHPPSSPLQHGPPGSLSGSGSVSLQASWDGEDPIASHQFHVRQTPPKAGGVPAASSAAPSGSPSASVSPRPDASASASGPGSTHTSPPGTAGSGFRGTQRARMSPDTAAATANMAAPLPRFDHVASSLTGALDREPLQEPERYMFKVGLGRSPNPPPRARRSRHGDDSDGGSVGSYDAVEGALEVTGGGSAGPATRSNSTGPGAAAAVTASGAGADAASSAAFTHEEDVLLRFSQAHGLNGPRPMTDGGQRRTGRRGGHGHSSSRITEDEPLPPYADPAVRFNFALHSQSSQGFAPLVRHDLALSRTTLVGASALSTERSATANSFGQQSRAKWGKVLQPSAEIVPRSRKGADGFLYAAASLLKDRSGGQYLSSEAAAVFGGQSTTLSGGPSLSALPFDVTAPLHTAHAAATSTATATGAATGAAPGAATGSEAVPGASLGPPASPMTAPAPTAATAATPSRSLAGAAAAMELAAATGYATGATRRDGLSSRGGSRSHSSSQQQHHSALLQPLTTTTTVTSITTPIRAPAEVLRWDETLRGEGSGGGPQWVATTTTTTTTVVRPSTAAAAFSGSGRARSEGAATAATNTMPAAAIGTGAANEGVETVKVYSARLGRMVPIPRTVTTAGTASSMATLGATTAPAPEVVQMGLTTRSLSTAQPSTLVTTRSFLLPPSQQPPPTPLASIYPTLDATTAAAMYNKTPAEAAGISGKDKHMVGRDTEILATPASYRIPDVSTVSTHASLREVKMYAMSGRDGSMEIDAVTRNPSPGPQRYGTAPGPFDPPAERDIPLLAPGFTTAPRGSIAAVAEKRELTQGQVLHYTPLDNTRGSRRLGTRIRDRKAWDGVGVGAARTEALQHQYEEEQRAEMSAVIARAQERGLLWDPTATATATATGTASGHGTQHSTTPTKLAQGASSGAGADLRLQDIRHAADFELALAVYEQHTNTANNTAGGAPVWASGGGLQRFDLPSAMASFVMRRPLPPPVLLPGDEAAALRAAAALDGDDAVLGASSRSAAGGGAHIGRRGGALQRPSTVNGTRRRPTDTAAAATGGRLRTAGGNGAGAGSLTASVVLPGPPGASARLAVPHLGSRLLRVLQMLAGEEPTEENTNAVHRADAVLEFAYHLRGVILTIESERERKRKEREEAAAVLQAQQLAEARRSSVAVLNPEKLLHDLQHGHHEHEHEQEHSEGHSHSHPHSRRNSHGSISSNQAHAHNHDQEHEHSHPSQHAHHRHSSSAEEEAALTAAAVAAVAGVAASGAEEQQQHEHEHKHKHEPPHFEHDAVFAPHPHSHSQSQSHESAAESHQHASPAAPAVPAVPAAAGGDEEEEAAAAAAADAEAEMLDPELEAALSAAHKAAAASQQHKHEAAAAAVAAEAAARQDLDHRATLALTEMLHQQEVETARQQQTARERRIAAGELDADQAATEAAIDATIAEAHRGDLHQVAAALAVSRSRSRSRASSRANSRANSRAPTPVSSRSPARTPTRTPVRTPPRTPVSARSAAEESGAEAAAAAVPHLHLPPAFISIAAPAQEQEQAADAGAEVAAAETPVADQPVPVVVAAAAAAAEATAAAAAAAATAEAAAAPEQHQSVEAVVEAEAAA